METAQILGTLLRKLAFLALIGFLVVVLAGPILAMLGVLLSFAIIGMVVWLPIRTLIYGRPVDWAQVKAATRKYGGPVWAGCNRLTGGALHHGRPVLAKAQAAGRFLAAIFRESACGALVGALLGLIRGLETASPGPAVLIGAGLGAVGAVVALSFRAPAGEPA